MPTDVSPPQSFDDELFAVRLHLAALAGELADALQTVGMLREHIAALESAHRGAATAAATPIDTE